jgi:pyruvate/2-oxoglutarate dehydrogenase complex dihydrolipoamide acyltransferase (E2) component
MVAKEIGAAATEEAKDLGSAAKREAKEVGSAAKQEAKDLGVTATRKATEKVMELSERRRRKRAEKHNATEAAMQQASELGVDLDQIKGSGAEGRITVRDVKQAADKQ